MTEIINPNGKQPSISIVEGSHRKAPKTPEVIEHLQADRLKLWAAVEPDETPGLGVVITQDELRGKASTAPSAFKRIRWGR